MTKKKILLILASAISVSILMVSIYRSQIRNCISLSVKSVPSPMPKRKSTYTESFSVLQYYFPWSWERQVKMRQPTELHDRLINKIAANGNFIWFTYPSNDNTIAQSVAKFDSASKEIKVYKIQDDENRVVNISDIYVTRDGTLWANISFPRPGLARFHSDKDDFEIITDQDGLLKSFDEKSDTYDLSDRRLGELSDGQLVVLLDHTIYLYNPDTNLASLIIGKNEGLSVKTIAIGKDDKIWFTVTDWDDKDLRMVDIHTGKVTNFGSPPNFSENYLAQPEIEEAGDAIVVDQQGRVWVSYFDRLEPDSNGSYVWHSIELPSVFVNTFDPYYSNRWANVFSTYSFSDGNIWFASDIGIVKYDIQNGTWCLSAEVKTFADYPITEDAEGNVWTMVDQQIYKLRP